jgi:hypothetical protein
MVTRVGVLALGLVACVSGPTELVVTTDTDLAIPDDIDTMRVEVVGAEGELQISSARLGPGEQPPPRTVIVRSETGYLGPYRIRARGLLDETTVVERVVDVELEAESSLVLAIDLSSSCVGVTCDTGETCEAGDCRSTVVDRSELSDFE